MVVVSYGQDKVLNRDNGKFVKTNAWKSLFRKIKPLHWNLTSFCIEWGFCVVLWLVWKHFQPVWPKYHVVNIINCVVLHNLTNRELLQHLNFCRRRNKDLQHTVIKTEVQNNHSYDEEHGDHERFYWNKGAGSRLKLLFIIHTNWSKKYIYAADRRLWEEIYRWNQASLQPMGK